MAKSVNSDYTDDKSYKRHACPGSCTKSWTHGVIYHRMSDAADGVGLQRSEESSTVCGSMSPLDHLRTSRGCGAGGDGGTSYLRAFLGRRGSV